MYISINCSHWFFFFSSHRSLFDFSLSLDIFHGLGDLPVTMTPPPWAQVVPSLRLSGWHNQGLMAQSAWDLGHLATLQACARARRRPRPSAAEALSGIGPGKTCTQVDGGRRVRRRPAGSGAAGPNRPVFRTRRRTPPARRTPDPGGSASQCRRALERRPISGGPATPPHAYSKEISCRYPCTSRRAPRLRRPGRPKSTSPQRQSMDAPTSYP
jgi:hypothetical protein